jgi:ornithine--oxo-acid transaminase
MAAGIATLEVMKAEKLVEASARRGAELKMALTRMVPGYELMKEVRGKGLMIGIEFGMPRSLTLKAAWSLLEAANKGLFCQMILIPLFKDHKLVCQVSGPGVHIIKLLPALTITDADRLWIRDSFDKSIADCHRVPGAVWDLGRNLAAHAVKARAGRAA